MQESKHKKFPIGRIIGVMIILLVAAAVFFPKALFFLTPDQQKVLQDFQTTYFAQSVPVEGEPQGFDWLRLAAIAILLAGCWVAHLAIKLVSTGIKLKSRHAETLKGLACNFLTYGVVIFGIIMALSIWGVNMVAMLTSLGVLGLIIGFGAQTLIEDVITGLFIIFEGQFHVNDIVTIDGFRGTVTAIGIRTTLLMDAGGNVKIINNSDIRTVTNLSEVTSVASAQVGISYHASIPAAEKAIEALLNALPTMYPDVFVYRPDYVGVQALSASSVDLKVVAKVDETVIYKAQRLLNRELKLCLDEAGIEIPFPQVVVHKGN